MEICLNYENFDNSLRSLIKSIKENKETTIQFLPKIQQLLHDYKNYNNHAELISRVKSVLKRLDNNLNIDDSTLQKWINGEAISVNPTISTTSSIDTTLPSRRAFRKNFLDKIYKDADVIKYQVEDKVKFDLANILLWDKEEHILVNPHDLNNNIKNYQEELFKTIKKFIESNKFIKTKIDDTLYNDNKYTGAFEEHFQALKELFGNVNPSILLNNYLSDVEKDKLFIEAFNAFQILLHFDEFVLNAFGDNINISQIRTRFSSENKYSLKNKSREMVWSNQKDDDIKLEDSINNISKTIITTTRMYDHRTGNVMHNRYISTKEFIAIINKLRGLYWNVDINKLPLENRGAYNKNFSEATKQYLYNLKLNNDHVPTFSELIITLLPGRKIRNIEGWAAVLDVVINTPTIFDTFDLLEQNLIYSIREELLDNRESTNNKENKSLLTLRTSNNFVLHTLAQTIEGIWPVKNCSVTEKEEIASLQELSNSEVGRIQYLLNNDINQLNHYTVFKPKVEVTKKGNVWSFLLPLNDSNYYTIKLRNGESGSFSIIDENGNSAKLEDLYKYESTLLKFIDSILHLNFSTNKDYFGNFKYVSKSDNVEGNSLTSIALENLLKLASGVLVNAELSKRTFEKYEKDKLDPKNKISSRLEYFEKAYEAEYGENNKAKMVFQLLTFDVIPKQQLATIQLIAMAKAISKGVSIARQVNDNEGNAISTSTPSRLVSGPERQWIDQKLDSNAPCHNFLLIQEPNLCKGLYSVRDYVTKHDDSKKYIEFSTREFLEDSFLNSFLNPILIKNEGGFNLLGNDTIAIIPAVYSDKNTVTKMVINLKPLLEKIGVKSTKDLLKSSKYIKDLRLYINEQLYSYYNNLFKKITYDLEILSKASVFKEIGITRLDYTAQSYKELEREANEHNLTVSEVFDRASKETGVKLNEELHIVRTKNGITVNNTLIDLYNRYKEGTKDDVVKVIEKPNSHTTKFWNNKNLELFQYLLNNKVDIDVYSKPEIRELFKKGTELGSWKGLDGKIIFGRITIGTGKDAKTLKIGNKIEFEIIKSELKQYYNTLLETYREQYKKERSKEKKKSIEVLANKIIEDSKKIDELDYEIHSLLNMLDVSFQLNPVLEYFNSIHYLFSQEYILSTVGSHINHPIKKGKVAVDENGNEVMTPFDYIKEESERTNAQNKRNVAHTAAVHPFELNLKYGVSEEYNITVIDDINDLMYNALGDNARLKPFDGATFVDPYSVHLENNSLQGESAGIHKKQFVHFYDDATGTGGIIKTAGFGITNYWMRNSPFIERLNKKMTNEIWKDENGNPINLDITKKIQNPDLVNIKGNNLYFTAYYKDFDEHGNEIYFKLANIVNTGDGSYELTWKSVNENGEIISNAEVRIENVSGINSTYQVYEKIFKGIKCVGLINGKLTDSGTAGESSILNTLTVINECGYIKEYKKGNSILNFNQDNFYQPAKRSLINYTVTAGAIKQGAANFNNKNKYYSEVDRDLNYYKIKMTNAGIQLDKQHNADDSEISMMTQVVSACAALGHNWNESSSLYRALYNLTEQGIESLLGDLTLTLSQGSELSIESKEKLHKTLTTIIIKSLATGSKAKDGVIYSITQELIDKFLSGLILTDEDFRKCPLSISDPNIFNKAQSQISSILNKSGIKLKFKGILSVLIPSHEIMKIYGGKMKGSFRNFKREIEELLKAMPTDLTTTDLMCGRTYILISKQTGKPTGKKIHIQSPFMTEDEKKDTYGDPKLIYSSYYELNDDVNKDNYTYQEYIEEGRNLAPYHCTFKVGEKTYSFYDLAVVKKAFQTSKQSPELRKEVQEELIRLSKGGPITLVGGQTVTVTDLEVFPAEVIMPKTVASLYGLTVDDSLDKIVDNPEFFVERLKLNLYLSNPDKNSYTVALKNINGKHLYIIDRATYNQRKDKFINNILPEIENDPLSGEVTRIDEDGNEIYKMSSVTDEICLTKDGHEIIITDNVEFYLDNLNYNTLYVSDENSFNTIINHESSNKSFNFWKKSIQQGDKNQFDLNEDLHKNPSSSYLQTLGHEMHTSFKKYLEIIAARIPAQSMQSFMPMKVVGFDESGHNNAYVCTQQIWLQGSDFDIDCVSLLTYEFDRSGKFVGWSPFFDLTNSNQLKISSNLSFPTGRDVNILDSSLFKKSTDLLTHIEKVIQAFTISYNQKGKAEFKISNPILTNELVNIINDLSLNGILDFNSLKPGDKQGAIKLLSKKYNTTLTEDFLLELFNFTTSEINKHNNYIKISPNKEAFTKNYVVELMIRIAKNPANLSQAHVSVDQTTDVAKRIADTSKYRALGDYVGHGNIGALLKAIEDNHVGKDVIGITAVGLKAFFALTLYTNTILNTNPGAATKLLKLITFNGKLYSIIANANVLDTSKVNQAILDAIAVSSERDAALLISALLSLATDNAKELCLAKLNANADMAGMYIYGLTMGIPFDELGKLLMSDLGNTVANLLKGSIITDKLNLYNLEKVLKYIKAPASKIQEVFKKESYVLVDITGKATTYKVWPQYMSVLFPDKKTNLGGEFYIPSPAKGEIGTPLYQIWELYLKESQKNKPEADRKQFILSGYNFSRFIDFLITKKHSNEQIALTALAALGELINLLLQRSTSKKPIDTHSKIWECHNALLESLLMEYKIPQDGSFDSFNTLYIGAERMKTLGALLGANQGIKNPIEEYLNFIFSFEKLGINFDEFMTNENVRAEAIAKEIKSKDPINIFGVLTTVDHYWGYMKTIHKKHQALMIGSKRYRTLYKYLKDIPASGPLVKKIQALNKLISYKMNNDYFIDANISITVPSGTPLYFINALKTASTTMSESMKIKLGTQGGNAVFKNIVDTVIIPALKEGRNTNTNSTIIAGIKNNKFIQSLRPNIFDKNPSKNASISYSTDIDMSPVDERGQAILANLRQEFDFLTLDFILKDENGNELFKMPIKEIFFIYNLIAYNGIAGQNTFTKVLDNYIAKFTENYREILKGYDLSGETFEIDDAELAAWTAQIGNPFANWSKYIYEKDKASMSYQLKQKVKGEQGDEYVQVGADLNNKNVILHIPTSTDVSGKIHSFDVKFKETHKFEFYKDSAYNINVLRDTVTGEIYPIPNIELNQLVELKNEKMVPKTDIIKNIIEMQRNGCK